MNDERWLLGGGFSSPGIGERETEWPSYGGREATPNPTCATCGGRLRGAKKCECERPEWRVKGEPYELGSLLRTDEAALAGELPAPIEPTPTAVLYLADCVEAMRAMPAQSVDAIVSDPPYGLEFMGKEWDRLDAAGGEVVEDLAAEGGFQDGAGGNPYTRSRIRYGQGPQAMQAWHERWATEALRVLKPGGHLLAFGGTRTYHRLACALEDAGFEIRDELATLTWVYASGFPKSHNVAKAIDKHLGVEPEVIATEERKHEPGNSLTGAGDSRPVTREITAPVSDEAKEWDGWGTALKPAHEPVVVARKPLVGSVAKNVLDYGTGAVNVAGCRIGSEERVNPPGELGANGIYSEMSREEAQARTTAGRWPANVLLTHHPDCREVGEREVRGDGNWEGLTESRGYEGGWDSTKPRTPSVGDVEVVPVYECVPGCPVAELDEQSGELAIAGNKPESMGGDAKPESSMFGIGFGGPSRVYTDRGGASRFFFCSKASQFERNAGLDDLPEVSFAQSHGGQTDVGTGEERYGGTDALGLNVVKRVRNRHPTVKPIELMRWLVRLVVPAGAVVLDPFMGSGTTGMACALEGVRFVGIEQDEEYLEVARRRIAYWTRTKELADAKGRSDYVAFAQGFESVRSSVPAEQLGLLGE